MAAGARPRIPCLRPRHELPVVTVIAGAGRQLRPRGPSSRRGRPCPTPPPHFGPPGVWRVLSRPFVLSWATETRGLGSNASHGEVPGPAVPSVTQKSSGSAAVCLNEAPLLSLPPAPCRSHPRRDDEGERSSSAPAPLSAPDGWGRFRPRTPSFLFDGLSSSCRLLTLASPEARVWASPPAPLSPGKAAEPRVAPPPMNWQLSNAHLQLGSSRLANDGALCEACCFKGFSSQN